MDGYAILFFAIPTKQSTTGAGQQMPKTGAKKEKTGSGSTTHIPKRYMIG
jgi:hypothetical protein